MKKYFLILFAFIPLSVFGQRVQLNNLPGQDGGMDIGEMLDQIMAPYYTQASNMRNRRIDHEVEQEIWTGIRTNIENFDRINRYIFSYESAFRDTTNSVSDPLVLAVTTARNAEKGTHSVVVKRLAAPDAFASAPVPLNIELPPSRFSVNIGDISREISFPGGSLPDLTASMKAFLSNDLDIEIINSSGDTRSLLIRGKESGKDKTISFDGDLSALQAVQLLSTGQITQEEIPWNSAQENLTLSNTQTRMDVSLPIVPNSILKFSATQTLLPQKTDSPRTQIEENHPLGEYSNIISLPGALPIFDEVLTQQPRVSETPQSFLVLHFNGGQSEQIFLGEENGYTRSLSDYAGKTLERIEVTADLTAISVSTLTLTSRPDGDLKPYHRISQAQDALFSYDGVDLERPSNSINDLARGLTLELKKESADKVTFTVSPNIERIKDTITQWALAYNTVVDETYHASTLSLEKIRSRSIKPLHRRKADGDDIVEGSLLSNPGLLSYRSSLRQLIGNSYGTGADNISLLDQIGLYVQRARGGTPTDPESVRRGLLTLDSAQLDRALNDNLDGVIRLFTSDPSTENASYSGVAVAAARLNESMVGGNGYITRINRDSGDKLRNIDRDIRKKEEEIARTERTERGSLLRMNQALADSKAQADSLRQRFGN